MENIVNIDAYKETVQAEVERCHKLMIRAKMVSGRAKADEMVDKYRPYPAFFRALNTILERGFTFNTSDEFPFKLSSTSDPLEVIACLEATGDITNKREFDAVWRVVCNLWRQKAKQSDPVAYVSRVRATVAGIWELFPDAFISSHRFAEAELVLARSAEPKHDLKLAFIDTSGLPDCSVEKLTEYYEAGHHYIAHNNIFGESSSGQKSNSTEIQVYKAIARCDSYPPLEQQEALVKKIVFTRSPRKMVALLVAFLEAEISLVYFESLLNLLSFDEDTAEAVEAESALGRIVNAIVDYPEDDWVPAIMVLGDIMKHDRANLEVYVDRFEAGQIAELEQRIYRRRLEAHAAQFPEKPLEAVRQAFLTPENEDTELPDEALLDRSMEAYQAILERGQVLVAASDDDLSEALGQLLPNQSKVPEPMSDMYAHLQVALDGKLTEETESETDDKTPQTLDERLSYRVEFFALVRELFKREFGVYPYNTQMLAILMMIDEELIAGNGLRGTYEQIKTGEGKSLILALVSAYFGSLNQNVDVITSNPYLARRDASRFTHFFAQAGLSAGSFAVRAENIGPNNPRVLYTTNHDLIFHYLACRLHNVPFFASQRHQVALVDEADNLCIDLGEQACRLAEETPGIFTEETLHRFMQFADIHAQAVVGDLPTAVKEFKQFAPETAEVHPIYIGLYLQSALRSAQVVEGQDFIIRDKKVLVVDVINTGRIEERTHWDQGLHEFVALRHKLPLPTHHGTSAHMNHPHFIRLYDRIHCISGTFGDRVDRDEIRSVYKLTGLDVPSHHPSIRQDEGLRLELDVEVFRAAVINRAIVLAQAERPVLIVTSSINESEWFYQALKAIPDLKIQLLNDASNTNLEGRHDDEESLVKAAGQAGVITVATSVAGRGADISPDQAALEAGGLHSVLTFVPANKRVEYQARGRAGRQGNPGSSEIIACAQTDLFIKQLGPGFVDCLVATALTRGPASVELGQLTELMRKARNLISSQARIMNLEKEELVLEALEQYFGLLSETVVSLRQKNLSLSMIDGGREAASFIVSSYLRDTWVSGFDYAHTVLNHDNLLDEDEARIEEATKSVLEAKLDQVFADIFGFEVGQPLQHLHPDFMQIVGAVYGLFRERLIEIEQRVQTFDQDKVKHLLRQLERKTRTVADKCVAEFGGATVVKINDYIKRQKNKRSGEATEEVD